MNSNLVSGSGSATLPSQINNPCVSVLMPVYNGEFYLREAVESILNQTFTDFEFIIIDDGSTDNTWQILTEYTAQDDRIMLHRNPKNLHLIRTLNKGLALARGEYIARHDADDVSLPERLATQVSYLQRHPEVGLLGTANYRINSQGQRGLAQPPVTDTEIRWKLLFGNIWCHPSMMIRRQLFENNEPFHKDYIHVEDYELWTRLIQHTRAATLPDPLVVYRVHDDSICAAHHEEQAHSVTSISTREINALFSEQPLTSSEIQALYRCYYAQQLTKENMALGGRVMFKLLRIFEQQPGIESDLVLAIQDRRWIKRLLAAITVRQWGDLWTSGLLGSIFRHDPLAVLNALFVYLPGRMLRQIGHILRISKRVPPPGFIL